MELCFYCAFIVGRKLGTQSKKNDVPLATYETVYPLIPGHTTKSFDLSKNLIAFDPICIKKKGVAAIMNSLTETFVVNVYGQFI